MDFNFSTRLFYDRSATTMNSLSGTAGRLTTEISTGKRILSPSDDSAAWMRLQGLAQGKADAKIDSANVKMAQSVLQQGDSTLASITEQLRAASDLFVQAGNGTLSDDAKKAIATQLSGILDSLVALANTKDARGAPLFGGSGDDAAVTKNADGSLGFAAGEAGAIPIGGDQSIQTSSNAKTFLSVEGGGDIGTVLTAMIAALNGGTALPDGAADALKTIADQTVSTQASLGARSARVDLVAGQMVDAAADRETTRSGLEDVDVTQAITDLQKTMTVLSATQASFSKLQSLSLFDYLK